MRRALIPAPRPRAAPPAPRTWATGAGADVDVGHRGDLLAQLHDDALRGALADPGHRLQARGVPGGERSDQLAWRAAGEHRKRDLGPDGLDGEQHQEEVALLL